MTEQTKKNLRVFCLCGQKMQVTAEMYGKPAKCVACHQKWFIPEKSEISTDTGSISLKEHPELLRMPGQFSRSLDGIGENAGEMKQYFKSTPQPITEIDIGACLEKKKITDSDNQEDIKKEEEGLSSDVEDEKLSENLAAPDVVLCKIQKIPLEPLEPLREIFSYQAELTRRKESLGSNDDEKYDNGLDNYEKALSYTLNRLYAFLRHEQKSTSKQLAVLEEEIARLNVALRIGDCSVSLYLSQTDDLRRSRESLVRQNHNLIAWQEIKEPAIAGDIAPISLESFNEESFEIYIPAARQIDSEMPLFVIYGDELRRLFEVRAALERRQSEWRRMVSENDFSAASVQDGLVETEAALSRNMASIRFCQQRIEQVVIDCDSDLKALGKYKEDVFERAAKKQLREDNLQEIKESIENAEENILRIRGLARQTSSANSPVEVPKPTTTLLERLRGAIGKHTYSTDSTLFIVAALLTILGLLMFTDSTSSGTDLAGSGFNVYSRGNSHAGGNTRPQLSCSNHYLFVGIVIGLLWYFLSTKEQRWINT